MKAVLGAYFEEFAPLSVVPKRIMARGHPGADGGRHVAGRPRPGGREPLPGTQTESSSSGIQMLIMWPVSP